MNKSILWAAIVGGLAVQWFIVPQMEGQAVKFVATVASGLGTFAVVLTLWALWKFRKKKTDGV